MVEAKANFVTCTAKRRVMIKKICLEEIVGFSFFETNIKTPELISISLKFKNQEKISEIFSFEIRKKEKEHMIFFFGGKKGSDIENYPKKYYKKIIILNSNQK